MDGFSSWVNGNFNLVQTVGIIGSLSMTAVALLLTAAASRRESKAREIQNILTLSDHHRNLWAGVAHKSELGRIFQNNAEVLKNPLTVAEEVFLNEAITHYMTGWRIAKSGGITTLKELGTDIKWFLSLPLPYAVWEKTKDFKNQKFVRFVERALDKAG